MAQRTSQAVTRRERSKMPNQKTKSIGLIALLLSAAPMLAQAPKPAPRGYVAPRTPDGHPDLQGTYDLATLTPLERPAGAKAVLTDAEAGKLEAAVADQ